MKVSAEEKRWIVVGIAMFKVAAPVLRNHIEQRMDKHYTDLDAHCRLLTTPCALETLTYVQVKADPTLKNLKYFKNINNNKGKSVYDYSIHDSVDLAKLYLSDYYLAQFSAFDDSLDMTAILRLLGFNNYKPAAIFSPLTPASADDVREHVRNKWGHFDNSEWTEAFFNGCFAKLEKLVMSLNLTAVEEKSTLDQLNDWKTKGCELCMGHAVDQNLLSFVQQDVKELIEKYKKTETEQIEMQTTVATLQDQQEEHDEQMKETREILERLVSVDKVLSKELPELRTRVEVVENNVEDMGQRMEHLGQEFTRFKKDHVKPEAYPVKPFDVNTCRSKLAEHYKRTAKVPTRVWSKHSQIDLDRIYSRLSWVKKKQTPTGSSESKLTHYSDLFKEDAKGVVPKRILVQGETGIGKTTFVKKLAVDWAQLVNGKTGDEQAASLRKYENNEGREDVSEARNKKGIQDDKDMLSEDEDASSEDDECTSHEKRQKTSGNRSDVLRKFELLLVVPLKDVSRCETWKEVINHSHLFPKDKEFSTDDLLSYVSNSDNQEKVLLVFDGFDEYRTASEADNFRSRSNSPICEIFRMDYLRECTVLVTSRPSTAVELQGSANKCARITGFDEIDQVYFMRKMLESDSQAEDLFVFLQEKKMLDLARVPLLNLFFCWLWSTPHRELQFVKGKTKLYHAIIRHFLLYGHNRHFPDQVSQVNQENYLEILNVIGEVALKSLLKGNQVFEYGELSVKVRGTESSIVGLLQLSEYEASWEPKEKVSFIHKSIQEYLAAMYVTNAGKLGGIEEHASTLEDCETLKNVFQFICGLSGAGAVEVFKHLSMIPVSDPSLHLSEIVSDKETKTYVPLCDVTGRHDRFHALVLDCFLEVTSKDQHLKHLFDCVGGIISLTRPLGPELLPHPDDLIYACLHSWAFLFEEHDHLYESVKYLNLCNIPLGSMGATKNSESVKVGFISAKFLQRKAKGSFRSILCCRDGHIHCYITI